MEYIQIQQTTNWDSSFFDCACIVIYSIQRNYSPSKFQSLKSQHGVAGYLDELFSAPDPILQALRSQSQVQSVIVGTADTQESIDRHG